MSNVGYATVSVIPSAKGFGKTLSTQIDPELSKAGESGGTKVTSALGGVLKKGALGVGVAVGGILGTALFKGFERLSAIDQAKAKLAGLGNSAGTVSKIMDNALASVKGTAFGLGDAATVAAGAVASGIKPGKDLTASLKLVADAATIAGVPLNEMGAIFNKVAASGKLQGDVIAQLGDQGIPILQLLAKQLHTTPAEVSKLASQGKIDFATFSQAMQAGLGGAALKSGDTFKGALANMYAALGRLGAGLLTGLFPIAKQVFGSLTTLLDDLTAKVTPLANSLSAKLPGAIKSIGDALKSLTAGGGGALKPLVDAFKTFVTDVATAAVKVAPALLAIVKGLEPIAKLGAVAAVVALTVAFHALGPIVLGLAAAFVGITGFVASNQTGFKILAGIIGAVLLPVLIQATVATIAQGVELLVTNAAWLAYGVVTFAMGTALKIATAAQWLMNAALDANPIGLVVIAIAALVAGLVIAYKNSETFRNIVDTAFTTIKTVVVGAIDFITAHWRIFATALLTILLGPLGLVVGLVISHFGTIKAIVTTAVSDIVAVVTTVFNTLAPIVTTAFNVILTVVQGVWLAIKLAIYIPILAIVELVRLNWLVISTIITTALNVIQLVVTTVWGVIGGTVLAAMTYIVGLVTTAWSGIQNIVTTAMTVVSTIISTAWAAINAVISAELAAIEAVVKAVWGVIGGTVTSVLGTIKGAVSSAWSSITGTISSAVSAIKSAVSTGFQAMYSTISGFVDKIAGLAAKFAAAGKTLGSHVISGLGEGLKAVGGFVADIGSAVKNAINSALHLPVHINGPGPLPDFDIPAFVRGTNFAPGGAALVGERGPELVNLPRGSQVIPNNKIGDVRPVSFGAGGMAASGDNSAAMLAELKQFNANWNRLPAALRQLGRQGA